MVNYFEKGKKIRNKYPKGTRIVLTADMAEPHGKHKGDTGTVMFVDGIGQLHINWDNGGSTPVVPFLDSFGRI